MATAAKKVGTKNCIAEFKDLMAKLDALTDEERSALHMTEALRASKPFVELKARMAERGHVLH